MRFMSVDDFKIWPPGISNGLASKCQVCGERPKFDFQINDDTWRLVVRPELRAGVICLPCLDTMAFHFGIDICQHLREVQFTGRQSTAVLVPALVVATARPSAPEGGKDG